VLYAQFTIHPFGKYGSETKLIKQSQRDRSHSETEK